MHSVLHFLAIVMALAGTLTAVAAWYVPLHKRHVDNDKDADFQSRPMAAAAMLFLGAVAAGYVANIP